ncbi:chymotrypsin-elastase inhibitor ixodidin-like [Leptopilina heterotoma]|uniref:chymotrypsin-elastase inhibitor ixodidin-like n=1 Tax=Leptopilina heterotoma TaxID=63436 RepID=UPI001CA8378B|nr:chymotrypsin-elastase inhibitor ixodidin-like [Leptopilina heterotoma]
MSPFLITFFIVLVASAGFVSTQQCGENSIWTECGTRCPKTCDNVRNPEPIPCTLECVRGCRCYRGYVRISSRNHNCVLERNCLRMEEIE